MTLFSQIPAERSDLSAVDAHHHLWNPARVALPWMGPEHEAINRVFEPPDLAPLLAATRVDETVLVQSACSDEDTDLLFEYAVQPWIGAVVAWVALEDPPRARDRLDALAGQPKLRGVRHLIHDEEDPHWILRRRVLESLGLLEERNLVLEVPVVFPRHLSDIPELARSFPRLTIVVDHLGKPPIGTDAMSTWAAELEAAAALPNVVGKISGLNTAVRSRAWDAHDLVPSIEIALEAFGPDRLACGSDWPVALLNGDYGRVWRETRRAIELVAPEHLEQLVAGTARSIYRLRGRVTDVVQEALDGAH